MRWTLIRATAMAIVLALPLAMTARAAEMAGVVMPHTRTVNGIKLILNGIGLRTYSILGIHIYVAGLYLERPNHDAQSILASPSLKVLQIHFVRGVSADRIRQAWKEGLVANCTPPCALPPSELRRFLSAMRPVRAGESYTFIFNRYGAKVYEGGQLLGQINNEHFARLVLAVFIGRQSTASERKLKRDLLGEE